MSTPLVSVVTAVYNDAPYLSECMLSVLGQSYGDIEYLVCDNHSTDRSYEIASDLAVHDARVRVIQPPRFVPQAQNFNFALSQISASSAFVKMIHADDYLLPNALKDMLNVATSDPRVGVVGGYALQESAPLCFGLDPDQVVFPGQEPCRLQLLGEVYPFGSPSNLMYRADLVRGRVSGFFPTGRFFFDINIAFELLQESDFGFVHQIVCFLRKQPDSLMVRAERLRWEHLFDLVIAEEYGPVFLEAVERVERLQALRSAYYLSLGRAWIEEHALRRPNPDLWDFHRRELAAIDRTIDRRLLSHGVARACGAALVNPLATASAVAHRRPWTP